MKRKKQIILLSIICIFLCNITVVKAVDTTNLIKVKDNTEVGYHYEHIGCIYVIEENCYMNYLDFSSPHYYFYSKDDDGIYEADFGVNAGEKFYKYFTKLKKKEYSPYHENKDGLMVTEYKKHTIRYGYHVYDKNGNPINNINDPLYKQYGQEKYVQLSKKDYNKLVKKFKKFEKIVKKQG